MKIVLFGCMLFSLCLTSCAGGWTSEDKDAFLQTCRERQTAGQDSVHEEPYCRCALDATMKYYKTIPEVVINKDSTALQSDLLQCRAVNK